MPEAFKFYSNICILGNEHNPVIPLSRDLLHRNIYNGITTHYSIKWGMMGSLQRTPWHGMTMFQLERSFTKLILGPTIMVQRSINSLSFSTIVPLGYQLTIPYKYLREYEFNQSQIILEFSQKKNLANNLIVLYCVLVLE